jgi:hypothetical protein
MRQAICLSEVIDQAYKVPPHKSIAASREALIPPHSEAFRALNAEYRHYAIARNGQLSMSVDCERVAPQFNPRHLALHCTLVHQSKMRPQRSRIVQRVIGIRKRDYCIQWPVHCVLPAQCLCYSTPATSSLAIHRSLTLSAQCNAGPS